MAPQECLWDSRRCSGLRRSVGLSCTHSSAAAPPAVPVIRPAQPGMATLQPIGRARALWDFPGGAPTDLPLSAGQVVNITRKIDPNWWEGEYNGRIGIFPVQYVKEEPLEVPTAQMASLTVSPTVPTSNNLLSSHTRFPLR